MARVRARPGQCTHRSRAIRYATAVSAQPVQEHGPDDPVEILHALPERFHEQFLAEYAAAAEAARQPEGYRVLHDMLRLWRLGAPALSDPGYEGRRQAVRDAVRAGHRGTPIEDVVPDWNERVEAARHRRTAG